MKTKFEIRKICKKIRTREKNLNGSECINLNTFYNVIENIRNNLTISNIGIYYPIKDEVSPLKILNISKILNFKVSLPIIDKKNNELIFETCDSFKYLRKGLFGTYEPHNNNKKIVPDLIFVPLLAYDLNFNRLGYGKGFYDKTLYKFRKVKKIFVIGLGYDNQIIDKLPVEDHDQKLDFIITEKRILDNINTK